MRGKAKIKLEPEPAQSTKRGLMLREATLEDYHQIASIESRYGLATKSYEEWTHLHLHSPLRYESQAEAPIGWVIENEDAQIVGSVGNLLLPYEFEGKRILAVTGRGWVAEPAYRSLALLLLDRLICQPDAELFLTNAITSASAPAFDALGCYRVPAGVWDRSGFWITHHSAFMQSVLTMRKFVLARPLRYPFAAAAFLKDGLTTKALRRADVEVQCCPCFDERFDDFWDQLRSKNPHRLLAVRSREMLEWHFHYALRKNSLWIAAVVDGPRIAAYAIFDRRDNLNFGLKRVRLVDFQSPDSSPHLLVPLLRWALRECRNKGIHMLENTGAWLGKGEVLDRLTPHQRQLSTWTYVYRANSRALAERLRNQNAWGPTLYDGSASL